MSITEKVAYLKGLADGLKLDTETAEGKLLSVVIDTLEDIAYEIEDLNENALDLGEEIDTLSDDLSDVESLLFGDDDDDEDDCCCCGGDDDEDDEDEEDACGCGGCCGDDDDFAYEVTCPNCKEEIVILEEDLVRGEIKCPNCNEKLEFEFDEDDEGDED